MTYISFGGCDNDDGVYDVGDGVGDGEAGPTLISLSAHHEPYRSEVRNDYGLNIFRIRFLDHLAEDDTSDCGADSGISNSDGSVGGGGGSRDGRDVISSSSSGDKGDDSYGGCNISESQSV